MQVNMFVKHALVAVSGKLEHEEITFTVLKFVFTINIFRLYY